VDFMLGADGKPKIAIIPQQSSRDVETADAETVVHSAEETKRSVSDNHLLALYLGQPG